MNNSKSNIWHILLLCNLFATLLLAGYLFLPFGEKAEAYDKFDFSNAKQYVMYIGTNDKETYEQIISTDDAKRIVNDICVKYVEGYTVSDVQGGWVDNSGVLTEENSLVYVFREASDEQIKSIMDEVLTALNQNSILLERRFSTYAFYSGTETESANFQ